MNNYYSAYSYGGFCYKTEYYIVQNIMIYNITQITFSDPFQVNVENVFNQLNLNLNIPHSINPYSINFSIFDFDNPTISTNFTISFFCQEIDGNLLEVSPITNLFFLPQTSIFTSLFFYISIKGLNYSLEQIDSVVLSPPGYKSLFSNVKDGVFMGSLVQLNTHDHNITFVDPQILLKFPYKNFTIVLKSFFDGTVYQDAKFLDPFQIETTEFIKYSSQTFPSIILYTNQTSSKNFIFSLKEDTLTSIGKKISEDDSLAYYNIPLYYNNGQNITINYQSGPDQVSKSYSFQIQDFQFNKIPKGVIQFDLLSDLSKTFSVTFNSSSYNYRNTPFAHRYIFLFNSEFPYGFVNGSLQTTFYYRSTHYSKQSLNFYSISEGNGGQETSYFEVIDGIDNLAPIILFGEIVQIQNNKYLFRVNISDNSIIAGFYLPTGSFKTLEYMVKGTFNNVLMEVPIDISNFQYFITFDCLGNAATRFPISPLYVDSNNIPHYISFPFKYEFFNIENVTYYKNDMDISEKPVYNTLYFNSSTIPFDFPFQFQLLDDVSVYYDSNSVFPIFYDNELKLFYCNFIIPKNTNKGEIAYKIISAYSFVYHTIFPPLRVSKSNFDNEGPIITNIINLNQVDGGSVSGFRISITDKNGFYKGYIKVVGSVDSSIFKFNFTFGDQYYHSGTINNCTFDLVLNISSSMCINQNFTIENIYLEDNGGRYSVFNRFPEKELTLLNALREVYSKIPEIITTESKNCLDVLDLTSPVLTSFSVDKTNVDVGSLNRNIKFNFSAKDPESGLMVSQMPIVYLEDLNLQVIQCESKLSSFNQTDANYNCDIELPVGFGFPGNILISVYGFINNGGSFSGFSNSDLNLTISTNYTFTTPILTSYEPYYNNSKNNLILYGKALDIIDLVKFEYYDGSQHIYAPISKIGQSCLVVPMYVYGSKLTGPFNVTVISSSKTSNTITIVPIGDFDSKIIDPTPTPSSTPVPTNPPQKCLGSPQCGGPSNGYCNENTGCVCYSPWIGNDCLSQVIIVDPPIINNTNPSTEIPINSSNIFYKSLVSLNSIREVSIDNKEIEKYQFEKWIFTQVDNSTNIYFTNITSKLTNKTFNVIATLKWFTNATIINFAKQNLTMNPSSMKYTIEITNYQFQNKLNSLQIIMSASFSANQTDGICSLNQFSDTSSGDNSNFLKIQIGNRSLYGRFIKRAMIDNNNIISLSNQLLDYNMNSINKPNQVQSFIGINIPYFSSNVIVDPDFSLLINPDSPSTCLDNGSKLSPSKIAGIVIGSVAFASVVTIVIVYAIYKNGKEKKFFNIVNVKLEKIDK